MLPQRADATLHDMNTSEQNKAAVRDCFAQASTGNFAALGEILTEDYVLHPEGVKGVDGLADMVQGYRDQIPDISIAIDHQFTEGDWVATRYTVRGRHVSGHDVEFSGLTVSRCNDGRIAEEWELVDVMTMLAQIGQAPAQATTQ